MPRRSRVVRRVVVPDAKYGNRLLSMFVSKVMKKGKKSTAERIVYSALDQIEEQQHRDPIEVFEKAVQNVTPVVEVKPRRVGGATYQLPLAVRPSRQLSLSMRWILSSARARQGRPMAECLATELVDAYRQQGTAVKRRDDTHRMAEANKAFVHYRW